MAVTVHLTCRRGARSLNERYTRMQVTTQNYICRRFAYFRDGLNSYRYSLEHFCADRILHRYRGENGRRKQEGSPEQKEKEDT